MPFQDGHNLSKGRPKGSKNKVQSQTKEFLKKLIEGNEEKIENELNSLKGKAFLDAVFNFMEYVQPKLSRTEVKAEVKTEEVDLSNLPQDVLDKLLGEDSEE
jgi:hypothetical protein